MASRLAPETSVSAEFFQDRSPGSRALLGFHEISKPFRISIVTRFRESFAGGRRFSNRWENLSSFEKETPGRIAVYVCARAVYRPEICAHEVSMLSRGQSNE